MRIHLFILLCLCFLYSCTQHQSVKLYEEKLKIYPLSPFEVVHTRSDPPVVTKFLIAEGNIRDMSKVKDTIKMYVDSLNESFVKKTDPLTCVLVYEADDKFDHTYQQTHPDL